MIRIIRSRSELESLRDAWNSLPGARRNPLLAHEWIAAAAAAFATDRRLCCVSAWNNDRLCGAVPLARISGRGVPRFEYVGASRLFEPIGLLYDADATLLELCDALMTLRYPVVLPRLAEPPDLPEKLSTRLRTTGRVRTTPGGASPYLPIRSDWTRYHASMSSRRRYDFRRVRTRLEQHGPVRVDMHIPTTDQLPVLLDRAFEIESAGWKGRQGSGLAVNAPLGRFFRDYAARASRAGILRICQLSVADVAIAMQIAVQFANRWWVLKTGYDEKWAACSPGMQLTMETVRHAFELGLEQFEFLGTAEPWLRVWTDHEHRFRGVCLYPRSMAGTISRIVDQAAAAVGRIRRRAGGIDRH